jgi:hypothetical protein
MLSFKALGAGVATFSGGIYSVAFSSVALSSISEGFFSASSEGPASVLAWITAASISAGFVSVSVCAFEASVIFLEGVELKVFTVSNTSSTFAILLILRVAAELFCAFGTVTSDEGLKVSSAFVSSIFGFSALSFSIFGSARSSEASFGIVADSPAFCVGGMGYLGLVAEEVSPPNSGTTADSIWRGRWVRTFNFLPFGVGSTGVAEAAVFLFFP